MQLEAVCVYFRSAERSSSLLSFSTPTGPKHPQLLGESLAWPRPHPRLASDALQQSRTIMRCVSAILPGRKSGRQGPARGRGGAEGAAATAHSLHTPTMQGLIVIYGENRSAGPTVRHAPPRPAAVTGWRARRGRQCVRVRTNALRGLRALGPGPPRAPRRPAGHCVTGCVQRGAL